MPQARAPLAGDQERRKMISEMLSALKREFGETLYSVVVFGSVARGTAEPSSDTEVLVVSADFPEREEGRMARLTKVLAELEKTEAFKGMKAKGMSTFIQFHALKPEEAKLHRPIYLEMVYDGILIYDREGLMATVLGRLEQRLRELGARRVLRKDGSWYWDIKSDVRKGEDAET